MKAAARKHRKGSLTRCVRDGEKDVSEGALAPCVLRISHQLRQLLTCWERVSVQEGESEERQIRAVFMFITAAQKGPRIARQWEGVDDAPVIYSKPTGSVTDPFQQGRKRVGADSSNSLRSLIKLLRRWPFAVVSWAPYCTVRAVGAYVQPLRERPAVVNRLVIVAGWLRRDKDYCDNNREHDNGPDQDLSALRHSRRLT